MEGVYNMFWKNLKGLSIWLFFSGDATYVNNTFNFLHHMREILGTEAKKIHSRMLMLFKFSSFFFFFFQRTCNSRDGWLECIKCLKHSSYWKTLHRYRFGLVCFYCAIELNSTGLYNEAVCCFIQKYVKLKNIWVFDDVWFLFSWKYPNLMNLKVQYFKIILPHFYIVLEEILDYTTH